MANQNQGAAAPPSVEDLNKRGASFIGNLELLEPHMVAIAREFDRFAAKDEVRTDGAEKVPRAGAATAEVGLGATVAGLVAAPFTAAGGLVTKVVQFLQKSGRAKDLERLGNEFLMIARPLDEEVKELKALAHRLRVEEAERHLVEKARKVHGALRRVDDTSGALVLSAAPEGQFLVQLALKMLHHIPPDNEEDELTRTVETSEQCWSIIDRFRKVREDLRGFQSRGAIC